MLTLFQIVIRKVLLLITITKILTISLRARVRCAVYFSRLQIRYSWRGTKWRLQTSFVFRDSLSSYFKVTTVSYKRICATINGRLRHGTSVISTRHCERSTLSPHHYPVRHPEDSLALRVFKSCVPKSVPAGNKSLLSRV